MRARQSGRRQFHEVLERRLLLSGGHAPGSLDLNFGVGGKVLLEPLWSVQDLAVLPDGKLLLGGPTAHQSLVEADFGIVRTLSDGSPELSFGEGGLVRTDFFGFGDLPNSLLVMPDGRFLLAGRAYTSADIRGPYHLAIARYHSDGTLDASFGVGGKATTDFGRPSLANAMLLQPDGKIVVAGEVGHSFNTSTTDFALARYHPDGSLDESFGIGGKVVTDFVGGGDQDRADAVAYAPDGKIIAVGRTYYGGLPTTTRDFALARYNSDGSLDSSFGTGGKLTSDFFGLLDEASSVTVLPDGKLLVGGGAQRTQAGPLHGFALARYDSDGTLDPNFGAGGKAFTGFQSRDTWATRQLVQPNGRIVLAGWSGDDLNNAYDFALARYRPDGTLDGSFGSAGRVLTDFAAGEISRDYAYAMAMQPDGQLVVGGFADALPGGQWGGLVRYHGDPVPAILMSEFHFSQAPHRIEIAFSENVGGSLGVEDLVVENLTTGELVPSEDLELIYDTQFNVASFAYTGDASAIAGVLADAEYRATILAAGVTTSDGTPLVSDHTLNFRFLMGDANNDGRVNLNDFNILASNFGQTGRDFTQGNFDYDPAGNVNLADFNLLASRFGISLLRDQNRPGWANTGTRGDTDDERDEETEPVTA